MRLTILIVLLTSFFAPLSAYGLIVTGTESVDIYGYHSDITTYQSSSVTTYSGAEISFLSVNDNSTVNIKDGIISHIDTHDDSKITINGGDIGFLNLYGKSLADISFIADLSWLIVADNTKVNIYGSAFWYSMGHLSGIWSNGKEFSFWALTKLDLDSGNIGDTLPPNITLHTLSNPKQLSVSPGIILLLLNRP